MLSLRTPSKAASFGGKSFPHQNPDATNGIGNRRGETHPKLTLVLALIVEISIEIATYGAAVGNAGFTIDGEPK